MPRSKTTATQPRGMGRIIANKSGTYTFQWFANSKLSQETYPTRPQAVARQAEVWQAKQTGNTAALDKSKGEVPFLDYCARWIERGQKRGESTKRIYRSILKRLAPKLAGRSLAWVANHRTEVEDIINAAGALYVSRARVIIVGCCKSAVIARDIPSHNLAGLDIAGDERVKPAEFYPASHAQLESLAGHLGERYGLLVWLGRYAGLRIGESLGVRRDDVIDGIDGGKVLVLRRQRLSDGTLAPLKSRKAGDSRRIPIGPFLAARLAETATDADGYYFGAEWRSTVMDHWERARDAAGLPRSYVTHMLRHQYASAMLSNGAPLDLVSKVLGHGSVEITSTVYAHWLPSDDAVFRSLEMAA